MSDLTYYCAAPGCQEEGRIITGGRLLCWEHADLLRRCDCGEDGKYLLPGENCGKCGFEYGTREAHQL